MGKQKLRPTLGDGRVAAQASGMRLREEPAPRRIK